MENIPTNDWKHRKIKAQRYLWNAESGESGAWALVSENRRYYDEWNLIYEITENGYTGTTANKYYYGADIAGTVYSTGGTSGLRMANIDGTLVYVFNNQTGNVEALYKADSSNELLAEYEYTPFGETRRQSGELSNKNPLRYSTRYHEGNTGLYYYGFRHYSPITKKWLSQDPIGELGGLNLYRFANNDPMNSYDNLGLCEKCTIYIPHGHGGTAGSTLIGAGAELAEALADYIYNKRSWFGFGNKELLGYTFVIPVTCGNYYIIEILKKGIRESFQKHSLVLKKTFLAICLNILMTGH